MAIFVQKLWDICTYINHDIADPRTAHYPLMSSPFYVVLIVIVYNLFVQCVGQQWMKNRNPYNLRTLIICYDITQVVVNFYLVIRIFRLTYWTGNYSLICQPVETGTSEHEIKILDTTYCYFMTKLMDLTDTVFYVLTKKKSHISFLHLYHHSGMVLCGWIAMKYIPGGQSIFFGMINGFIHGLMYFYYFLAAMKYVDSRHIFWKRTLTQLQMLQFALMALHLLLVLVTPYCGFPRFIAFMVVPQQTFIFFMFADFYRKAYLMKDKSS